MSAAVASSEKPRSAEQTLRRLFLTLFLRGRGARGLNRRKAPASIARKLVAVLIFYALFGCIAFALLKQPLLNLSVYLHAMTFIFVSMFVASSAGELLFNKEESDILLHRPITPKALLWAKIAVLVQVSLWLAGAFNLVGFFVGPIFMRAWLFPVAHVLSTSLEALFCASFVVLTYQLCLRWFGRERLERLMTTAQVFVSIAFILSAQIVPRLLVRFGAELTFSWDTWWLGLLPPAWFAGLDDAVAGSHAPLAWLLAAGAVLATGIVVWAAFGKLAQDYVTGLQHLGDGAQRKASSRPGRRWATKLVEMPPLRWVLRDPGARGAFLVTAAYMSRDRDVKLRLYPGLAPFLVLPVIMFFQRNANLPFSIAAAGSFVGMVPMMALRLLRFSAQWQAADLFRMVPIRGPASLCDGARWAVMLFLGVPVLAVYVLATLLFVHDSRLVLLALPGIVASPVFLLAAVHDGAAVPLSQPGEDARSAGRGLIMFVMIFVSLVLAGLTAWSMAHGAFWKFIAGEVVVVILAYAALRVGARNIKWPAID